jgi:DNA-directed RNA polymerase alpha subunit
MPESLEFRIESTSLLNTPDSFNSPLHYGKFAFSDFRKGQGITFANSLRRVLLYDLESQGITHISVRMKDAGEKEKGSSGSAHDALKNQSSEGNGGNSLRSSNQIHEFSSIPGMRESILELLLNLRSLVFKRSTREGENPVSSQKIYKFRFQECLQKYTQEKVGNSHPSLGNFDFQNTELPFILCGRHLGNDLIVNSDQYLASFLPSQCPDFEIHYIVGSSSGSSNSPNFKTKIPESSEGQLPLEPALERSLWLPTDGTFFPVRKVNYSVEERNLSVHPQSRTAQLGSNDQFESVFVEIWTNGSLSPKDACDEALHILIRLFQKAQGS